MPQGRHGQEITSLESVVLLQKQLHGENSHEVVTTSKKLANRYNSYAMQFLGEGKLSKHFNVLKERIKPQNLLRSSPSGIGSLAQVAGLNGGSETRT